MSLPSSALAPLSGADWPMRIYVAVTPCAAAWPAASARKNVISCFMVVSLVRERIVHGAWRGQMSKLMLFNHFYVSCDSLARPAQGLTKATGGRHRTLPPRQTGSENVTSCARNTRFRLACPVLIRRQPGSPSPEGQQGDRP